MSPKSALANIRNLHIVRGLAALLVVIFHAKYVFWIGGENYRNQVGFHDFLDYFIFGLDMLSSCGKECVILFFVLSAFVIKHTSNHFHSKWGDFYKLRLLRIYLPFIFSLIFSIVLLFICVRFVNPDINTDHLRHYNSRIFAAVNDFSIKQVFFTFFFIQDGEFAGANYAYWSLGHELLFYLFFPLYNRLSAKYIFLLATSFILIFLASGYEVFYYQFFFLGGLLLYQYFSMRSQKPLIGNKTFYSFLLLFLFVAVNLANKLVSEKFSDIVTLLYCIFIFDYILYYVNKSPHVLIKLADMSFTLYLNHLPLLLLGYSFLTLYTGQLVFVSRLPYYAGVLVALLLSIPIYQLIEKPSIKLLKKLRG